MSLFSCLGFQYKGVVSGGTIAVLVSEEPMRAAAHDGRLRLSKFVFQAFAASKPGATL